MDEIIDELDEATGGMDERWQAGVRYAIAIIRNHQPTPDAVFKRCWLAILPHIEVTHEEQAAIALRAALQPAPKETSDE